MRNTISLPKVIFFVFMITIVVFAISRISSSSSTHAQAAIDESRITYLSVPIVAQDTLSGIAAEYYSDEFGSMENYITRIKQYNSLSSDQIYAGNHLIVPIYNSSDNV